MPSASELMDAREEPQLSVSAASALPLSFRGLGVLASLLELDVGLGEDVTSLGLVPLHADKTTIAAKVAPEIFCTRLITSPLRRASIGTGSGTTPLVSALRLQHAVFASSTRRVPPKGRGLAQSAPGVAASGGHKRSDPMDSNTEVRRLVKALKDGGQAETAAVLKALGT